MMFNSNEVAVALENYCDWFYRYLEFRILLSIVLPLFSVSFNHLNRLYTARVTNKFCAKSQEKEAGLTVE